MSKPIAARSPRVARRRPAGPSARRRGAAAWVTRALLAAALLLPFAPELRAQTQDVSEFVPTAAERAADAVVTPPAGTPEHERLAPRARAVPLDGEIELDGALDEAVWSRAPAIVDFWQREPEEGAAASQRTEVRFVYDGRTLYIGARMHDERGAEGVTSRLVRRDGDVQSDELRVRFDTYLDHRGETFFAVNPAGVRRDADAPSGSNLDFGWDPVWRAAARVDSLGWTAEMAIPFAQLRFRQGEAQRWGLQVERTVKRLNEEQRWSFWPLNEQGGPSRYGHLEGIAAPAVRTNRLEVLPYAVSQLDVSGEVEAENPFERRTDPTYRLGADLKYLVTSNMTLNATFNPDFGQAEVDPAVVNLSAFETFFPEKREFFIQGSGVFGFGSFWCRFCSNVSSLDLLFTRRIGRSPQGAGLARAAGEHAEVPEATTILGAAKLTGQLGGGTSIGVLNAVTAREHARVAAGAERFDQEVEPLANYFVGRVKQDFMDGDLQVGGMLTSVVRDFEDPALEDALNRDSESVGVDAEYWWGDRTYHVLFSAAATRIAGTEAAIHRAQTSSARYFQRPDREGGGNGLFTNRYDPTLTEMRGYGLYSRVAKDAGDWLWEGALNVRSPGFENNDIAFLTRTDFIWMNANLARTWTTPTDWYRQLSVTAGAQQEFNFDGDLTQRQLHAHTFLQAPFWWNFSAFVLLRPETFDDRLTRGGPVVRRAGVTFASVFVSTDARRPWVIDVNPSAGWAADDGYEWNLQAGLTLKPRPNVSLRLGPSYRASRSTAQYVTAVADPTAEAFGGRRYVFADLERRSLSMSTRLSWTFRPGMSLELFAQPLISANDFSSFKEFSAPRALERSVYGRDVGTIRTEGEGFDRVNFVDPDGDGPAEEFSFGHRDFTFRSLRGNAVFRWEYVPGSTLFLIWTQDRSATDPAGDFAFGRDVEGMFEAPGNHSFMVKLTYWLGL